LDLVGPVEDHQRIVILVVAEQLQTNHTIVDLAIVADDSQHIAHLRLKGLVEGDITRRGSADDVHTPRVRRHTALERCGLEANRIDRGLRARNEPLTLLVDLEPEVPVQRRAAHDRARVLVLREAKA
jgi:hypothetical protein